MSSIFRQQPFLTIAQLVTTWAGELAPNDPNAVTHLTHFLKQDIANGLLDNAGPLQNGERQGIYLITPENQAGYIKGGDIDIKFLQSQFASDHIVVMKEASLDFAKRHGYPAPSWWTEQESHLSISAASPDAADSVAAARLSSPQLIRAKAPGRRPRKFNETTDRMRADIRSGSILPEDLGDMPEKVLASRYGVSRDTARKSRKAVLSEMPQTPKTQ